MRITKKQISKAQSGVSCAFVPLTHKRGIKLYRRKWERDYAAEQQTIAHAYGFGPRVFDLIKLSKPIKVNYHSKLQYGYITQRATKICQLSKRDWRKLEKLMLKHAFDIGDVCSWHNVGYIRGKPVCIDFDAVTLGAYSFP